MATLCRTLCRTLRLTPDRICQRLWRGLAAAFLALLACMACLACMASLAFAASPAIEVSTATELRATPTLDGKVITRLAPGARGERTGTQGGWVKLRVADHEGWVRLTHTKEIGAGSPAATQASQASVSNPITGLVGMFSATSNKPTATTGTRGLTQEQLANAQPAPAEVRQLDKYAVTGAQAEQFARSGKVASRSIEAYTGADK